MVIMILNCDDVQFIRCVLPKRRISMQGLQPFDIAKYCTFLRVTSYMRTTARLEFLHVAHMLKWWYFFVHISSKFHRKELQGHEWLDNKNFAFAVCIFFFVSKYSLFVLLLFKSPAWTAMYFTETIYHFLYGYIEIIMILIHKRIIHVLTFNCKSRFWSFLRNFRVCSHLFTYCVMEFAPVTIIELWYKSITNCSEGQKSHSM